MKLLICCWVFFLYISFVQCRTKKKDCKKLRFVQRINQDNHEVYGLVGFDFKFDCRVVGMPEPNITWTKDDLPIQDVSYRSFGHKGLEKVFVLNLKNLLVADSGRYKCTADNGECKAISTSLKLIIKDNLPREIPRVKYLRPLNPSIQVGESVKFTCVVEKRADFTPHIKWVKYRTYKVPTTLPPTTSTANTSLSTTFELKTTTKTTATSTTTTTTTSVPDDEKEHSARLDAERVGKTEYVNDGIVYEKTELKVERTHISELIFSSASLADSAEYRCMAFNEIGFDQIKSTLEVHPKPPLSRHELEQIYIRKYGGKPHKLPFSLAAIVVIPVCLTIIIIIGCMWWHSNEERLGEERKKIELEKGILLNNSTKTEEKKIPVEVEPIVSLRSTTSDSYSIDEQMRLMQQQHGSNQQL